MKIGCYDLKQVWRVSIKFWRIISKSPYKNLHTGMNRNFKEHCLDEIRNQIAALQQSGSEVHYVGHQ